MSSPRSLPRRAAALLLCLAPLALAPLALAPLALAPLALATGAAPQGEGDAPLMLRLRDGSIHWVTVEGHDPEGVTFERFDTGGVVRLPWSFLDPVQERELRERFGYVDVTGDEVLISADRLVMVDGKELVGRIVDRTADAILVKTRGATIPVPLDRIGGAATTVQVPALEVYTRSELYARELAAIDPEEARGNFELAQFCERILDYAHAVEHYERARQLDPDFRPDDVAVALDRSERRAILQEQIDYLSEAELMAARKRYDEALARIEAFPDVYPESPLIADAARKRENIESSRQRALSELVRRRWYSEASRHARQAGSTMALDEALAYVDDQMGEDVLAGVVADAQQLSESVQPDEVRQLWNDRSRVRWKRVSYGLGTWLLGEEEALAGRFEEEAVAEPTSEKAEQRAELAEKLERFMRSQQIARNARGREAERDDREAFWKELGSNARSNWILAYYAENTADFEVHPRPLFRTCRSCGGKGAREILISGARGGQAGGSGLRLVECEACHGLGVVRRISYR